MRRTLTLGLLLAFICFPLLGQRFTSSIRGKTTVPTGEPLGGVQVTVTNTDTGLTRTSFTISLRITTYPGT